MRHDIYTLPEITMVGGQTETLQFRLFDANGDPFSGASGNFAVVDFSDQEGDPVISKAVDISLGGSNIASVDLAPSDTLELHGKYIYQLTLYDTSDNVEIPGQGIMQITHNINQSFLDI